MLSFTEITEDNFFVFLALQVGKRQKRFVDNALGIVARGYIYRDHRARVMGICADNRPIGLLLVKDLDEEPACYDLQQFMIDKRFQNKGYGTAALKKLIAELEKERKYDCVEVCVKKDNAAALKTFFKLGFEDSGYIDESVPDSLNLIYRF